MSLPLVLAKRSRTAPFHDRDAAESSSVLVKLVALGLTALLASASVCARNNFISHPPNLAAHRSSVVLLHFWATWCPPCREELSALVQFFHGPYQAMKEDGLVLLTVSNDLRTKDLQKFLDEQELPFPVYFDPYAELNRRLKVVALPATLIIDRKGEIVQYLPGKQPWNQPCMESIVREYLTP